MNLRIGAHPYLVRTRRAYAAMLLDRDAAGDRTRAAELIDQGRIYASKRYFGPTNSAKAANPTISEEGRFGRGHPVSKPIEPVDFAPHAESIGFGAA